MPLVEMSEDVLRLIQSHLTWLDFLSFRFTCLQCYSSIEYYLLVTLDVHFRPHRLLMKAIQDNKIQLVENYLAIGQRNVQIKFSPGHHQNEALMLASELGHSRIVLLLLKEPSVNPSDMSNMALKKACYHNHIQVVHALLLDPRVDPTCENNYCLRQAVALGYKDIVEALLQDKRIDPSFDSSVLITMACSNEHTQVIDLLLNDDRIDPTNDGSLIAFNMVCQSGLNDIIQMFTHHIRFNVKKVMDMQQSMRQQ